jgi:uncharacterized protein (DUF433 family)
MTTQAQYPHLSFDPSGEARIDGTRYKVSNLAAEHYHHGWSAEELLRQHPDLRPEQVFAALTYFYDHFTSIVDEMRQSFDEFESQRKRQALSRNDLLARTARPESAP